MKFVIFLLLAISSFTLASSIQGRPAEGAFRSRLIGEFTPGYYITSSFLAIRNIIDMSPKLPNQLGICKEIGIFSASVKALKANIDNDPELKALVRPSEAAEVGALHSEASELQTFCGDAIDGDHVVSANIGNMPFLKSAVQQIEPHLMAVNKLTASFFDPKK